MSAGIINGNTVAQKVRDEVAAGVDALIEARGEAARPCLALIVFENDPVSLRLVGMKKRDCESVGISARVFRLPEETGERELIELIARLNGDPGVTGILCQLPLPAHINTKKVLAAVDKAKDADGFSAEIGCDRSDIAACTPAGIIRLIEETGVEICGKHAVIVGRSNIVGKPMAIQLLLRDATVTVCHTKTKNLAELTRLADILVVAAGCPGLVTADMVKPGAIVIDVGMNYTENGLVGDVDHEAAAEVASFITPVPGGVGPMTRAMLLYNTFLLAQKANSEFGIRNSEL